MGKAENIIETYLVNQAEKNGCLCWKFVSPGLNGVHDRLLVLPEITVFVECKREHGGVLSEQQKLRIKELDKLHIPNYVVNSRDEIDTVFKKHLKGDYTL